MRVAVGGERREPDEVVEGEHAVGGRGLLVGIDGMCRVDLDVLDAAEARQRPEFAGDDDEGGDVDFDSDDDPGAW